MNLNLIFCFFSLLLILCATMVIISDHPVFSLLFLISCFILSSFLLLILECEFIALIFVIVYVGAIAVLFLFSVMMLESKVKHLSKNKVNFFPVGAFFCSALIFPCISEILIKFQGNSSDSLFYLNSFRNWYDFVDSSVDIEVYSQILYSYYALQLLVSGLILLVILVGVVYLTNNYNTKRHSKYQSVFKQLSRDSKFIF